MTDKGFHEETVHQLDHFFVAFHSRVKNSDGRSAMHNAVGGRTA